MKPKKVVEVFFYNGERELVDIKFSEHGPFVDYFVVVQSGQSFSGQRKPVLDVSQYPTTWGVRKQQIVPIVIPPCEPSEIEHNMDSRLAVEICQRKKLTRQVLADACGDLGYDDLILVTDTDEVIRQSVLRWLRSLPSRPRLLSLQQYYGALNLHREQVAPKSVVVVPFGDFSDYLHAGKILRDRLVEERPDYVLDNHGWHFSWCLGHAGVDNKYQSMPWYATADSGQLPPRPEESLPIIVHPASLPNYVFRNRDGKYKTLLADTP